MSNWQAFVFDLDDTLYPERDYVLSGFLSVAKWADGELGIEPKCGFERLLALYESGVRGDTFNRWIKEFGCRDETIVSRMVKVYREHEPKIAPFPETSDVLAEIHLHDRVGLVSDGYLDVQKRKFAALGLAAHFDAVVFSDEWGKEAWKPNLKPFLEAMRLLSVSPDSAVYVADNPEKDFIGARHIGMLTVRIIRPAGEYATLLPRTPLHAPDRNISDLRELLGI